MSRPGVRSLTWSAVGLMLAGCGGTDRPPMAPAGGVVTHNGAPVEGATVMFMPQEGAPATGVTDAEGRFTLSTWGEPGVALGPAAVTVSKSEGDHAAPDREIAPDDPDYARLTGLDGTLPPAPRALLPVQYGHPETSGLTAEVEKDAAENQFAFDLAD